MPIPQGFVFACKDVMPAGDIRAKFLGYDAVAGKTVPLTKWIYLQYKFGDAFREISMQLKDFIFCECALLPSTKQLAVIYPSGMLKLFNAAGSCTLTDEIGYKEEKMQSISADGKAFWSVVPTLNAVVNYSPDDRRVLMRIGGGKSTAFDTPVSLTRIENSLYVCNEGSSMVRSINLGTYSVADYLTFQEPIYKYFIADNKEIVQLESGIYIL